MILIREKVHLYLPLHHRATPHRVAPTQTETIG
jgi:hypothetical protein